LKDQRPCRAGKGEPIEDRRQLVEYIAQGSKPKDAWRIGTEHEKFGFYRRTLTALPYEGDHGIRACSRA
jgi:glutamate--cysteine ligase